MQLIEIDKDRYRKHLRVVFAGIAVALLVISISFSSLIIQLFSTPDAPHFWHNLGGVAFAAIVIAYALHRLRDHPYMHEVVYVWNLKQQLNRIHRKMKNIEASVEKNNHDAMIIMNYMHRGSKQLYLLDDNTITMSALNSKIRLLDEKMKTAGIDTSTENYDPSMLDKY